MAGIAVHEEINPVADGWLTRFIDQVGGDDRIHWASALGRTIPRLDEARKTAVWNSWLNQYWLDRIRGIPCQLEPEEAGVLAEWCTALEPVFSQVVDRICESPAPAFRYAHIYYQLRRSNLAEHHPDAMAKLLTYLLPSANTTPFDPGEVAGIVEKLAGTLVPRRKLFHICDELARLGYPGARELRDTVQKAGNDPQS
jgi:hypothetical protein